MGLAMQLAAQAIVTIICNGECRLKYFPGQAVKPFKDLAEFGHLTVSRKQDGGYRITSHRPASEAELDDKGLTANLSYHPLDDSGRRLGKIFVQFNDEGQCVHIFPSLNSPDDLDRPDVQHLFRFAKQHQPEPVST